ncbi:hypothetical protein [Rhodococcus erythropolis]|uniref:hypothetical protein n=1 Tax=Rhodococcus erythropolis TaxID=1833 RepID=UPI001BE9A474|nr:hypothetical protein [Rhodococcus erythropolis]MBT2269052.1 hypothetical protein [Rhodococcus erythropolis]
MTTGNVKTLLPDDFVTKEGAKIARSAVKPWPLACCVSPICPGLLSVGEFAGLPVVSAVAVLEDVVVLVG